MRPDSYKREDIESIIKNTKPKYLIFGFKSDGIRSIPATYNLVIDIAVSEEAVYEKLEKVDPGFRIFTIGSEPMTPDDWMKAVAALRQTETEKEERELLQKLKDKYEK